MKCGLVIQMLMGGISLLRLLPLELISFKFLRL